MDSFDYIIVGAGSAGCLLANRLSADPRNRVLLLEAGGEDRSIWLHVPIGYRYTIGNPRYDWRFKTAPEPQLNNRSIACPRGKVLGGSSAINGMFQIRGQAGDFDHWRQLGLEGWSWESVLPYFKAHEDFALGKSPSHGAGGELSVEEARVAWPALEIAKRAAQQFGLPALDDFNTGDNEGVGPIHLTQKKGRRWSSASAFLRPALKRPNLAVQTEAVVDRITFDGMRATGLEYTLGRQQRRKAIAQREVVIAAGAICSPTILMRSGIGPADHLREHGVNVRLDRPGVGGNLQDHLQLHLSYRVDGVGTLNERYRSLWRRAAMALEYALFRRGPLSMGPTTLAMFAHSHPGFDRANIGICVFPFSRTGAGATAAFHAFPGLTISAYDLRPESRGTVRLTSAMPNAEPEIRFNYLTTDRDRVVAVNSVRVMRQIMRQSAFAPLKPREILPNPKARDEESSELLAMFRDHATTIFHPVGTAKMGLPSDPLAVLDARLRVMGVDGLRVVDASVMPTITSGNTNAPTMMIAEKGAAMILEDARRAARAK